MFSLRGRKALVVGIANRDSIAWGCAQAFRAQGADLAVTWLNEKAERFVRPLGEELGAEILMPLDVTTPSASMRFRPGRCLPALLRASITSTNCWTRQPRVRRPNHSPRSRTWGRWRPFSPRTRPAI